MRFLLKEKTCHIYGCAKLNKFIIKQTLNLTDLCLCMKLAQSLTINSKVKEGFLFVQKSTNYRQIMSEKVIYLNIYKNISNIIIYLTT